MNVNFVQFAKLNFNPEASETTCVLDEVAQLYISIMCS